VIGFTSEEQLTGWLDDAGIGYDEGQLGLAIAHLMRIGRLQTPRADQWERPGEARPTWLNEPPVHAG
jgi:hypothetical protein